MTITRTLENASSESAETVNLTPFTRNGWIERERSTRGGGFVIEARQAGDTPEYPLSRVVTARPAKVFHPSTPDTKHDGVMVAVDVYSTIKVEDSLSGLTGHTPLRTTIQIAWAGGTLVLPYDALQQLLSTVAELYDSVLAGDPGDVVINRIAQGSADLDG
jgi:hypothetical protein